MIETATMPAVTDESTESPNGFIAYVRTPDTPYERLREHLDRLHDSGLSWRKIAELPEYKGVPPEKPIPHGTLCSIAGGWEPRGLRLRNRLDLPNSATVIPIAGVVPEGSQALLAQECSRCGQWFISNHPRRSKCFICSPYRGKKEKPHA